VHGLIAGSRIRFDQLRIFIIAAWPTASATHARQALEAARAGAAGRGFVHFATRRRAKLTRPNSTRDILAAARADFDRRRKFRNLGTGVH